MSKAEEKTTELMKKAKDFIPDGGYSEKELNLAFLCSSKATTKQRKTWNWVGRMLKQFFYLYKLNGVQTKMKKKFIKKY